MIILTRPNGVTPGAATGQQSLLPSSRLVSVLGHSAPSPAALDGPSPPVLARDWPKWESFLYIHSRVAAGGLRIVSSRSRGIEIRDLSVMLGTELILRRASVIAPPGSVVGLLGANGCGKSTLLRAALGLVPALAGQVTVGLHHWDARKGPSRVARREVSYLPQRTPLDPTLPIVASQVVSMGLIPRHGSLLPWRRREASAVAAAMDALGVGHLRDHPVTHLSGGQMQRVVLSRVFIQQAPHMFLDEPFAALDQAASDRLWALLGEHANSGGTSLVVHHDRADLEAHADIVIDLGAAAQLVHHSSPPVLVD